MIDLEVYKISLLWGICLPDSCSSSDFANLSFIIPFQVSSNSCQTAASSNIEFDAGDYGAIAFFSIVLLLMALSTGYEIFHLFIRKKPHSSILNAFSVITNTLRIVEVKKDKDEITCLHGMRVFSLIFLMYGFTYGLQILSPLENLLDFLSWITNRLITVYFEGILVIDTFFFISGLLVSYKYLRLEGKGVDFNIFVYYVMRVLRLTPALFAIVLLNATLMRHMGSGPIWPLMRSTLIVDNCRENWWSTLLYVQNYATPNYCTPMIAWLSWILAFGLIVICFVCPAIVEDDFHPIKSPMHVSMIRIAWSIALSWFVFACVYGFSGPVNNLLSLPILQVISKISYCTFLTNMTVMTFASLQMKTGVHFSNIDVLHKFWPNLVYSLFIGYIWTLAFESPIIVLQKFLVSGISKLTNPVFTYHEQIIERFKGNRKSKLMNSKL
ncbi:hypothetical protein FQA39_LY01250 [Lamprigera yunnana]|nr:hypothetical protein FQA39_LY01250 [Lamprigera yunnana]